MELKRHEDEWKGRGMKKNGRKGHEEEWKGRDMKKNGMEGT